MTTSPRSPSWLPLVTILLALLAAGAVFVHLNTASPVDLGKVHAVSQADGMPEVDQLLGRPTSVTRGENGATSWYYARPYYWYAFRVDFAPTGNVVRCVFDD